MSPKRKTQDDREIKYLTQDQVRRFFKAIPKEATWDRLMFAFIYRFGILTQEACDLPAEAVDLRRGEITIRGRQGRPDAHLHDPTRSTDVYANLSTKRRNEYLGRLERSGAVVKLR